MHNGKPYVISEDIKVLLAPWARKNGFVLPPDDFFLQLLEEERVYLCRIFGDESVEAVLSVDLERGIDRLIDQSKTAVISMSRTYKKASMHIHATRLVDANLDDCGLGPRFGMPEIKHQIARISQSHKELVLVDDVLFSGRGMEELINLLNQNGVSVPCVVAGIAIGNGLERVLNNTKAEVAFVRFYEQVIDEVCERDFYPGVPLSGRTIQRATIESGAPYLFPFGKPCEWASIPSDKAASFSRFCLEQTVKLWEMIEAYSTKVVRCCDLERLPLGVSYSDQRFVDRLKVL